jgi:hypothetical protein
MLIVCPNCATSYGVEMASLRLASGSASFVASVAAGFGKRSSPIQTSAWSQRMQCRRYGAPWPLSPKLRPMRRERRCRACGEPRQFWLMSWKRVGAGRTARQPRLRARPPSRSGEACTRDGDPAEPAHLSGGCPGHRRCQATVLVAIVAAILMAVLVTILATIVVAVAAVTVTFAVPYSRTCGDRRGNCCRAYRCCLGHAANRVVLCHARFAGEPSRHAFCPPCCNG